MPEVTIGANPLLNVLRVVFQGNFFYGELRVALVHHRRLRHPVGRLGRPNRHPTTNRVLKG